MLLLACLFVGISLVTAQTQKITGVVISEEDGQPVVGASVLVKGTTQGTITDVDGNFNLANVPSSAKTLQISYIGMQTQEVIIKPTLKVILKADAQKLDEIVVTAMGISREKKALGYAVQDVKSDVLTRAANTDLAGALQGKVSGIDITPSSGMPGASSKITIRGSRSFTGDNTPLYVIDGMPIASTADVSTSLTDGAYGTDYANRAVDIDPNDIESINILKGQAASAWGPRISELPNDPNYGGNTNNSYTNKYGKQPDRYYVPQLAAAGMDPWATPKAYNNMKDFFETGVSWSNNVNVAQKFDKGNYSFSMGNTTTNGIVPSRSTTAPQLDYRI